VVDWRSESAQPKSGLSERGGEGMSTLKELMGDKTKGDGRKFALDWWDRDRWFEPIFKDISGDWSGLRESGFLAYFPESGYTEWEEWTPPKQTRRSEAGMNTVEKLRDFARWNRKYATDESKLQLSDDIEKVLDIVEAVKKDEARQPWFVVEALHKLDEARRG